MKIYKSRENCKQIFAASPIDIVPNQIADNYYPREEFPAEGNHEFRSQANDNVPNTKSYNRADRIKLNLLDKAGFDSSFDISRGNILLIGDDEAKLLSLSIQFHKIFLQSGFVTRIINFSQFTNLSFIEQANPEFCYLVRFDEHDDANMLPHSFYAYFSNIFVFALKNIDACGKYVDSSKLSKRTRNILSKLARDKFFAREQISLLKENDFLSISNDDETFQSISIDKSGL